MKKIFYLYLLFFGFSSLYSQNIDIYTIGTMADSLPYYRHAVVYHNGELISHLNIEGAANTEATGIFVHNDDVYVSGTQNAPYWGGALVWKNESVDTLSMDALAHGIYVSTSGNVYVVGDKVYGTIYNDRAKLWKNGEDLYDLPNGYAMSVFIDESNNEEDAYFGGLFGTGAVVWKNGVRYNRMLYGQYESSVRSVFFDHGHVYAGGYAETPAFNLPVPIGKVWKNGDEIYSFGDANYPVYVHTVCVFGNDVYAGGNQIWYGSLTQAKVWKNGEELYSYDPPINNDVPFASITKIVVLEDNVYAAGYVGPNGKVWKNGEELFSFLNCWIEDMFIDTHGVGIAEHEAEAGVKVYPNPAREQVTVKLPLTKNGEGAKAVFVLYDVQGRELLRQEIGDKESINVSRFGAEIYIYTVEFGERKSTGKLVKN
ncbi:MAG: T9SS type A sorting domain-containing protein [Bacteroidales bacterium]|nr:T9SS type A sorting domain-containing protein [Bacteroidales bacterium]